MAGRDGLLVEEIAHIGQAMDFVVFGLPKRTPGAIEVGTLLERPLRRLVSVPVQNVGFQIPTDYVVGYGLGYRELYRNLPFICTLKPSVYARDAAGPATPVLVELAAP